MSALALETSVGGGFRPTVPRPPQRPLGLFSFVWRFARNPLTVWAEELFRTPVVVAPGRTAMWAVVSEPSAIRRVMVDNIANYPKDNFQLRVLKPGLGESVLTTDGEAWKRVRRTLAPLFTPRHAATMASEMRRITEARVEDWLGAGDGAVIDLPEEMIRLTFDILGATLFSNAVARDAEFERLTRDFVEKGGQLDPLDALGAPAWVPRLRQFAAARARRAYRRKLRSVIDERAALLAGAPEDAPADLLSALLKATDPETGAGLTESEVIDNLITFILAGHETTARALAWTLYLVGRAPDALARVEAEADELSGEAADWTDRSPWIRAVFEEALRLFPTAPILTRVALADDVLGGKTVPAGAMILIGPYIIHRHAALWDQPDLFAPERFLPGAREAIDRFAFMPFGAGPRVCIGQRFAMQEAVIALATIFSRVRLEPVSKEEPRPVQRITLKPEGDLRMRVRRRPPQADGAHQGVTPNRLILRP